MFIINCFLIILSLVLEMLIVFVVCLFVYLLISSLRGEYSSYKMRKKFRELKNMN